MQFFFHRGSMSYIMYGMDPKCFLKIIHFYFVYCLFYKFRTSSDGVEHWKSINFYWRLVMYITRNVLRILFSITACIMFQISSWLKMLSDYLKTTEKAEDLPEKTIENRY